MKTYMAYGVQFSGWFPGSLFEDVSQRLFKRMEQRFRSLIRWLSKNDIFIRQMSRSADEGSGYKGLGKRLFQTSVFYKGGRAYLGVEKVKEDNRFWEHTVSVVFRERAAQIFAAHVEGMTIHVKRKRLMPIPVDKSIPRASDFGGGLWSLYPEPRYRWIKKGKSIVFGEYLGGKDFVVMYIGKKQVQLKSVGQPLIESLQLALETGIDGVMDDLIREFGDKLKTEFRLSPLSGFRLSRTLQAGQIEIRNWAHWRRVP